MEKKDLRNYVVDKGGTWVSPEKLPHYFTAEKLRMAWNGDYVKIRGPITLKINYESDHGAWSDVYRDRVSCEAVGGYWDAARGECRKWPSSKVPVFTEIIEIPEGFIMEWRNTEAKTAEYYWGGGYNIEITEYIEPTFLEKHGTHILIGTGIALAAIALGLHFIKE